MNWRAIPAEERFFLRVVESGGCWLWCGTTTHNGYGQFRVDGRTVYVHRWSYEWHIGPIPKGMELDHLCRNRACANPMHLEPVTRAENVRRGAQVALKTHCAQGHEWTPDTIRIELDGVRRCAVCTRAKNRASYERNRDAVNARRRAAYAVRS